MPSLGLVVVFWQFLLAVLLLLLLRLLPVNHRMLLRLAVVVPLRGKPPRAVVVVSDCLGSLLL